MPPRMLPMMMPLSSAERGPMCGVLRRMLEEIPCREDENIDILWTGFCTTGVFIVD